MNLRQLIERPDRPFASQPQVARYFPAASMEDARRRLGRSIERGDGPGIVIGGAGIGKSLLLQVLAAQFRERFDVVLLACAQLCTRRALLQAIHFELGLDFRRRDEGELRLSLLDTLLASDESTEGLLLLVDESQALANHLLEELRLLTNLSRGGAPRIRLIMAGLPALEEKFATPELQSFSQRLASRCYLAPLTRAETEQYVRAQLAASQADADRLVAAGSYDAIFAESDGVPRLVNQICDRALMLAEARGLESIDAKLVRAAWADLQQLPTTEEPSSVVAKSDVPHITSPSNVVEFGSLQAPPPVPVEAKFQTLVFSPPPKAKIEPPPVAGSAKPLRAKPAETPRAASAAPPSPAPPSPTPANGPRVFSAPAPDAIDPFDDSFEEEELVLESFATLASIFGRRTPRVENNREPAISRLVQNALDASSDAAAEIDTCCEPESDDEVAPEERSPKPTIRLKVVADPPSSDEEPRSKPTRETRREPKETPVPVSATAELADQPEPSILVIEDDLDQPARPQPGVRRESYRQLFTRLRHGT